MAGAGARQPLERHGALEAIASLDDLVYGPLVWELSWLWVGGLMQADDVKGLAEGTLRDRRWDLSCARASARVPVRKGGEGGRRGCWAQWWQTHYRVSHKL